ncbi:helix-turn-helix transcriptional regulator [Clostridium sp. 'deep sea']|jgi:putative transcriptional regulator|uniref:helix-turn-helix transcriptional regulator n=1 Tax=Clostridium sp. 'deep sea' TaxID=2779445 RepID=UPI001896814C|nr:helix-turn-helix transcriptional regulator [Clostridium sp. 'deep sea']QOR36568.1 helix-turn-helix transcriptional regulator [Clostridium sp. 'deep sea']
MVEVSQKKIREGLRIRRKKKGLTQKELAQELGMSRSFYGLIETGLREPSMDVAIKMARYFDTTIEDLFYRSYWLKYLDSREIKEIDVVYRKQ